MVKAQGGGVVLTDQSMPPPPLQLRRADVNDQKQVTALVTKAGGSSKFRCVATMKRTHTIARTRGPGARLAGLATVYLLALLPDFAVRFVLWMLAHTVYRITVVGKPNIPLKGPVILAARVEDDDAEEFTDTVRLEVPVQGDTVGDVVAAESALLGQLSDQIADAIQTLTE